jgi:serine/threonine-protein kinase
MTQLSKYTLHELLGKGGYGTVYRATDTALNVPRAVKILHPSILAELDMTALARFRQEAQLAAQLEHPHLVPVYDLGEDQGRHFQVMKYMAGGSLKQVLAQGPLPFAVALTILEQLASALDHIHTRPTPLIHRDIKPGNILFDSDPRTGTVQARLGDLGLAKALSGAGNVSMTVTGGMLGTPAYMAPELWRGQAVGPTTDLYALACVFGEILTGTLLFLGDSPAVVMTRAGWPAMAGAMAERRAGRANRRVATRPGPKAGGALYRSRGICEDSEGYD